MIESPTRPLVVLLVEEDGTDADLIAQRIRDAAPAVPVIVVAGVSASLASSARDRLVSTISHDLRNPLSTIQICAAALLDPAPLPPESVRQTSELIQRSAVWMQKILQDLVDSEKLDAERVAAHRTPLDVAEPISSVDTTAG